MTTRSRREGSKKYRKGRVDDRQRGEKSYQIEGIK